MGKKNEEYKKLIGKILKEIEEYKKSLHKLYGSKPNGLSELENLENYLKMYYEKLKALEKGHPMAIHPTWFQNWLKAVQTDWHNHKIKFQHK